MQEDTTTKRCPTESSPEVRITADWSHLLDDAAPPTVLRPNPPKRNYNAKLLQLDPLLSPEECTRLNTAAERIGFGRTAYPQHYRGNLRLIVTDQGLADKLWERVRRFVPSWKVRDDAPGCVATQRDAAPSASSLAVLNPGTSVIATTPSRSRMPRSS